MKKKSLVVNAALNAFNTILTMSFSLITYPYVTRVLQPENLGKVNYSSSIVSYFLLISALGIEIYAAREGAKRRDNEIELKKFCSQIFTINFFTMLTAYIAFIVTLFLLPQLKSYKTLLIIDSFGLLAAWIGVTWANLIFEDYFFITIRSILIQVISIVFLFAFVRTENDYQVYAAITVLSKLFVSILNFVHIKKNCNFGFTRKSDFSVHIRPIMIFFSNNLAVSIYLNSDTTMIGWYLGDIQVGLYSTAVKIYSVVRTVIASVYNVSVARLSVYSTEKNLYNYRNLLNKIIKMVVFTSVPATAGLIILSNNIIYIISGPSYLNASDGLKILSGAFLFAVLGGVMGYCIAIPFQKEKVVLKATMFSALENALLNILLIPTLGIEGAALTTLLSELTVFLILLFSLKEFWRLILFKDILKDFLKSIVGIIPLFPCFFLVRSLKLAIFLEILLFTVCGSAIYLLLQVMIKNSCISILAQLKHNFLKKLSERR